METGVLLFNTFDLASLLEETLIDRFTWIFDRSGWFPVYSVDRSCVKIDTKFL